MKPTFVHGLLLGALVNGAFLAGLWCAPHVGVLSADPGPALVFPQEGRGSPPTAGRRPDPQYNADPSSTLPTESASAPLVYGGDSGQAGSANDFIAVTGSYGVGTSVLYVLDTASRQLAVYEARGGSPGSRRLVFVGARRIDLDLQLEAYNDKSDYLYRDLRREFDGRRPEGADATGAATGDETSAGK